ncbi:MAG: hypothetical protein ACYTGL_18180 [Planctomycetota bacterium]|jgi:hypothetical protein
MNVETDTTDGLPVECRICGKTAWVSAITPSADVTCPHCGCLLWIGDAWKNVPDPIQRLSQLGADVDVDASGEVQSIRFSGAIYNDSVIEQLAGLDDVAVIDVRDTAISDRGAARLAQLLPNTTVLC